MLVKVCLPLILYLWIRIRIYITALNNGLLAKKFHGKLCTPGLPCRLTVNLSTASQALLHQAPCSLYGLPANILTIFSCIVLHAWALRRAHYGPRPLRVWPAPLVPCSSRRTSPAGRPRDPSHYRSETVADNVLDRFLLLLGFKQGWLGLQMTQAKYFDFWMSYSASFLYLEY